MDQNGEGSGALELLLQPAIAQPDPEGGKGCKETDHQAEHDKHDPNSDQRERHADQEEQG